MVACSSLVIYYERKISGNVNFLMPGFSYATGEKFEVIYCSNSASGCFKNFNGALLIEKSVKLFFYVLVNADYL